MPKLFHESGRGITYRNTALGLCVRLIYTRKGTVTVTRIFSKRTSVTPIAEETVQATADGLRKAHAMRLPKVSYG
jgi:hypothetical protein